MIASALATRTRQAHVRTLLAAGLTLTLSACGGGDASEAVVTKERAPTPVEVITVAAGQDAGAVRASGLVAYKREPTLAFKAPGVIERIAVEEGDVVRKGQRLAWLQPTEVAAGAAEARAALETAERQLARAEQLFQEGFFPQSRLDDARLAVARAKAARDATAFTRDTAVIVAPADGVVLRRLAEPSQVAAAGAPILAIGETRSGAVVRVGVAANAAQRIRVGDPVRLALSGERQADGRVTQIAAQSDRATGAFEVEISVAADARSGEVAEAWIRPRDAAASTTATSVRAPALSLLDARADQGVVFVVGPDDVARRRPVQTAGVEGEEVVILSGLTPGERVIARGAAYVRDGDRVAPTAQP